MSRLALLAATALLAVACAPSSAVHQTRYPDGRPQEEYGTRNGVRHGKARTWHAIGTIATEGTYIAGRREGTFTTFADDGSVLYRALFINDEEVWRSSDPTAQPDMQQVSIARRKVIDEALAPTTASVPVPWFSSLDRTTSLSRVGLQMGLGGPDKLPFGSVKRTEIFGNYMRGRLGGYGQFSQTTLEAPSGLMFSGRQTLEGGATFRLPSTGLGTATSRVGVLVPIGNDNGDGFVASTAGSFQRPTDAASSVPSAVAIRTGANLTRVTRRFVLQGDAGIDWLVAGEPSALDALARANVGVGFGSRSALIHLELTNTISISDPSRRLHSIGFGGGIRIVKGWLSGVFSHCISGDTSLTAAVGYEL